MTPGIYTVKNLPDYVSKKIGGIIQVELNDISMKITLTFDKVSWAEGVLQFDEKSFFNTLLGFTSFWDYIPNKEEIGRKITNVGTIDEIHYESDVSDKSLVNGVRQPKLHSFLYINLLDEKFFLIQFVNKTVMNTIRF